MKKYLPFDQLESNIRTSRMNKVLEYLDQCDSSAWYFFPAGTGRGTLNKMVKMGILNCGEDQQDYWLTSIGLKVAYILPGGEIVMKEWIDAAKAETV